MPEAPTVLQRFQAIVLEDHDLQDELRRCADRSSFVIRVLERASERGCALEPADVEAALDAAARAWLMRWVAR